MSECFCRVGEEYRAVHGLVAGSIFNEKIASPESAVTVLVEELPVTRGDKCQCLTLRVTALLLYFFRRWEVTPWIFSISPEGL